MSIGGSAISKELTHIGNAAEQNENSMVKVVEENRSSTTHRILAVTIANFCWQLVAPTLAEVIRHTMIFLLVHVG